MAKKAKAETNLTRDVSVYRGRTIEVLRSPASLKDRLGAAVKLTIDGVDIPLELTEHGYLSHAHMFTTFSTPFELAEDLIRQFGDAPVRYEGHGHDDDGHDHDHDHDHDHG